MLAAITRRGRWVLYLAVVLSLALCLLPAEKVVAGELQQEENTYNYVPLIINPRQDTVPRIGVEGVFSAEMPAPSEAGNWSGQVKSPF